VALPEVPDEKEEAIWALTQYYLEEMIKKEVDVIPVDYVRVRGLKQLGRREEEGGGGQVGEKERRGGCKVEWMKGIRKKKAKIAATSVVHDACTLGKQAFFWYLSFREAWPTMGPPPQCTAHVLMPPRATPPLSCIRLKPKTAARPKRGRARIPTCKYMYICLHTNTPQHTQKIVVRSKLAGNNNNARLFGQ